ncbi:extracellular solute-binding protein [Ruminiclostridium cellobioparum]|uniref:ABC-type sugar transport system, periplasmic component n=1 Tax=Ruminiclostridium cellobioparum subsp. termitidis CT1112 TaxID=1195236 RepID=S0FT60_RUMCE|nr:extracellular solute-binding protein [Ruminiclostridium cellobioparum]EMS72334.1 ABC-type sugar transport system, periplasmic component [Ruminiclostridium cellobioparum subsp. termitidis CT1112]
MKFNYLRKAVSLAMAISMTAALFTACGSQNSTDSSASSAQSTTSSSAGSSVSANKDPLGKYDPAIDISFVRGIDDDLAANILPKTPGETLEDNRWTKLYKDELGINVNYAWTVKGNETSDAYLQKINVTLASGELPDVVLVNPSQLKQLVDSEMVEDMTQYYNDYASEQLKQYMSVEGTGNIDSVTFDGKMMAIPETVAMNEGTQYLWIRNDWLKKLNLQPPKAMDDVLKIAEAFTTKDPDGNGKNDTFGLPVTKDLYSGCMGTEGFFAGYHAYPNMWVEDGSGKLVWGSTLPETKVALQKLADMYKSGQIDKEFGVKDGGKVAETVIAGKFGLDYGAQWNPMYPLISNYNNDKNADWTAYPIVSADDKKVMVPNKFNQTRIFAVKKGYKNPEALVKLFNMHIEKNWGKTADFNKYYMPVENGAVGVWKFSPVCPSPVFKNLDAFIAIDDARKANDFSTLTGEPKVIQANIEAYEKGDDTMWGWMKIYGKDGAFRSMVDYKNNDQLLKEKFTGAPTKTMAEKKTTLDKMEKEVFIKIIMGSVAIDEFDKFVSDWNKLGGADMTKEVNEWYDSVKSK